MADKKGWIKLYRQIQDSAIWNDNRRLKAWIDILLNANIEDKEWFYKGQLIKIKRGQYLTSNRKLQNRWDCSTNTVTKILHEFTELGMIKVEIPDQRYTLLTVIKYDNFQKGVYSDRDTYRDSDRDSDKDSNRDRYRDSDQDSDRVQLKNNKNNNNYIKNDKELKKYDSGGYEIE